jgi:hypothetical protein
METLAQAALQNQLLDFSTIMKLYSSASIAEKQRMVESSERKIKEQNAQQQQQQLQVQQQQAQMEQQTAMAKMEHEANMNSENNETKIIVANINAQARQYDEANVLLNQEDVGMSEEARAKLDESIRQFNARLDLDKQRLEFDKQKAKTDAKLKEKQINSRPKTTAKK